MIRFYGFGHRISYPMVFENEKGKRVKNRCPKYRLKGSQYFGGYHGGNGIRRIMESVDIIKDQRQDDDRYQE